jgi:hypothetical protein
LAYLTELRNQTSWSIVALHFIDEGLNNDCDLKTLLKDRASMNGSHILMKADEA